MEIINLIKHLNKEYGHTFIIATHDQNICNNMNIHYKLDKGVLEQEEYCENKSSSCLSFLKNCKAFKGVCLRYNRLFVWLVVILLIINISVFIAFKFFDAGLIFKHKINVIIEQTLDAQVSMDDFSLNDRQIFISNLSLEENQGKYKFKASQVYVDYNLFFVIFSNFSDKVLLKM